VTAPPAVVAFDLDGTLVDSVADIAAALNIALRERGRAPVGVDEVRRLVGHGARNLCARAWAASAPERGPVTDPAAVADDVVDELLGAFRAHYARDLATLTRPFDGIPAALDALRAAGVVVVVTTNKPGVLARPLVEALLPGRCAAVIGPDDVGGRLKPDPAMVRAAAVAGGSDVVCFVGDSAVDIDTARAAGVPVVGVAWGLRPDEVRDPGRPVDVVVDHPDELAEAVLRLLSRGATAHRPSVVRSPS
jgi:phosphoglycolate phosphatase